MALSSYESRLIALLRELSALTEQKIQATIRRDVGTLDRLVQDEMPSLVELRRLLLGASQLSDEARHLIASMATALNDRIEFLHEQLETHLGYIDFMKFVYGLEDTEHFVDRTL